MSDPFPRQQARTRGFRLGVASVFTVADDGSRVVFVRSRGGADPLAALWAYDADGGERTVFDPSDAAGADRITAEERDRRERAGERLTGVVAFATDPPARTASFVVGERLFVADLVRGEARELASAGPAFDPRPAPVGSRVAYVTHGKLHVIDTSTGADTLLGADEDPDVSWGLAEFVAAEEMDRLRGYWWAPDGERILTARVDQRPVSTWHIASPVDPAAAPRAIRYPQTGTPNAEVTMHMVDMTGGRTQVDWERETFEYLITVSWTEEGPPLALVQSRDQRTVRVLGIDPDTGSTETVWEDRDEHWTHIVAGVPAWLPGGRLLTAGHRDDTRCLLIDGEPATPAGLQVESVLDAGDDVVFRATDDPTEMHVWRLAADGALARLTETPGIHTAAVGGDLVVLTSETMEEPLAVSVVVRKGEALHTLACHAETPTLVPRPTFFSGGPKELRTALFTPDGEEPAGPLPVLLDPYGGPHFGRVTRASRSHLESQWFADQGFAVLVIDGRGTPYRGVAWDQAVHHDIIDAALEDQVEAMHAAAERYPFLDLSRVAMRGWSYGGYLTCAALLRRPDVFHAGIAGAPVTDLRYYDTHYMERYLGTPDEHPESYDRSDLVKDAANLKGELLLIHGLADDNVYVTHTLQLSKALMEAGRRHAVIPLSGITHRPVDEASAENMLKIEVEFLRKALGIPLPG